MKQGTASAQYRKKGISCKKEGIGGHSMQANYEKHMGIQIYGWMKSRKGRYRMMYDTDWSGEWNLSRQSSSDLDTSIDPHNTMPNLYNLLHVQPTYI